MTQERGHGRRLLFTEVLIPRLQRLGLISARVAPRYREIGLIE